jgi:hypothetical protein
MIMTRRSLAVHDRDLARAIGMNEAIVFEWLWFFLHSKRIDDPNGRVKYGRRWARFSYETLYLQSDLLDSQRTLIRTVNKLEKLGLIIAMQSRDGKDYAIHFARLHEIVGLEHYQQYVEESNIDGLDDWDLTFEAIPKVRQPLRQTSQNGQSQASQNGYPQYSPGSPNTVDTLTDLATQTNQNGQPPIYEESITLSITDSSKDSTTTLPNGNGAEAPAPARIFAAISRITHHGLKVTAEDRTAILATVGKLQNLETAQKEKLVLDTHLIEDYALWRMLLFWRGKDGFPNLTIFENEFRYDFALNWYDSATNRKQLDWIKRDFPDWRTRLFEGDYAAFREEVQAYIAAQKQKKQAKAQDHASRNIPYGATPAVAVTPQEIAQIFGRDQHNDHSSGDENY